MRESSNAYRTVLETESQLHGGKGTRDGTPPPPRKELGRRVLGSGEGGHTECHHCSFVWQVAVWVAR